MSFGPAVNQLLNLFAPTMMRARISVVDDSPREGRESQNPSRGSLASVNEIFDIPIFRLGFLNAAVSLAIRCRDMRRYEFMAMGALR